MIYIFSVSFERTADRLIGRCKAKNTLKTYDTLIKKFETFANENGIEVNPACSQIVGNFICHLADNKASLSEFLKLGPALVLLHESQGHDSLPSVRKPYIKLLLAGARREAAARKQTTVKAACLTKAQIHKVINHVWPKGPGVIDYNINLIDWRTVMKVYTMYKTWCQFDCYSHLTSDHVIIEDDAVTILFPKAKNDQMYAGTVTLLSVLGDNHPRCPKLMFKTYFQVMKFQSHETNYLNCRIAVRKNVQISKPKEKLSYTTSLENSRAILAKLNIEGKFSEKSFKVAGVSEAFNQNISLEDAMYHGRWRCIDTPAIYCHRSRAKRLKVSKYVD